MNWQIVITFGSSLIAAGLALIAVVIYLRYSSTNLRRQAESAAQATQQQGQQLSDEIKDLMRQLDEMAVKVDQRIEGRASELRQLLDSADKKACELQQLIGRYAPERPQRNDDIARLGSEGLDPVEIAQRTKADVGEVELVLNLRRTNN